MLKGALSSLLLLSLLAFGQAQTPANSVVDSLQNELARLQKEVAHLKAESQQLRGMLASAPAKPDTPAKNFQKPDSIPSVPGNDTGFWLSKGKKRHNKNCRYYKAATGAYCGPKEGVACRICGG